jgi:hypothetical protein
MVPVLALDILEEVRHRCASVAIPLLWQSLKITAQHLQGVALVVNFGLRAEAQAAKYWYRGAPPLDGMLEQKACHHRREDKPPPLYRRAQRQTNQGDRRGIGLQGALNIPLAVQLR